MMTNSRAPTPDGSRKNTRPASIAMPMVPMHSVSGLSVRPARVSASSHRCAPKAMYEPSASASAPATTLNVTGWSGRGLRSSWKPYRTMRVSSGGYSRASANGSARYSQGSQFSRGSSATSTGMASDPAMRAATTAITTENKVAAKTRARARPALRPSSICSTYAQIEPGRYLPSCPTRKICAPRPTPMGSPRSSSRTCQLSVEQPIPTTTARRESTVRCHCRPLIVFATSAQFVQSCQTAAAMTRTMRRVRARLMRMDLALRVFFSAGVPGVVVSLMPSSPSSPAGCLRRARTR